MTIFTAGPNGANILNLLSIGTTTRQTVTSTETDSYLSSGQRSVFYGSFSVNSGGTTVSGGTITGWSLFGANGQLNWSITGVNADLATIANSSNSTAITAMFLPAGSTYIGSSNATASDLLIGTGGNDTYIGGAAAETYETAGGTNTIKGGTGTNIVQFGSAFSGYSFAANGGNAFTVTDSVTSRNGIDHISGVQSLKFTDITVTVGADNHLVLPTTTASQAVLWGSETLHSTGFDGINISDSSTNMLGQLGSLEALAKSGQLGTISLTNSGIVTLNLTSDQVTNDAAALKAIASPVVIDVASTANTSFSGTGDPGTVVVFSGIASQYNIFATGGGGVTVVDNGTGRTSAEHFANVTALQFSDQTDFVANAPSSSGATTGNITELYSAAFGRQPDVLGLAYYQQMLSANPSTPLTTFASNFLASPEYKNNAAHNYAQGTSGDTSFVNDLYTNLLHRAPETGAIPYYLDLINQITTGTTQGTAAYTTALANAHAVVLTDVSQSPEFVGDVQVTGQVSTSGHWLVLS